MPATRERSLLYRVYMRSWFWRVRRFLWWFRSDRRCERCYRPLVLHWWDLRWAPSTAAVLTVHHVTYARLGRERRSDVQLLCWPCHQGRDWWRHRA